MAPGLLVASPSMGCPFFNHTLVLLVDHSEEGSFGFVLNKATDLSMIDVFKEVGVPGRSELATSTPVLLGGPVSPEAGWILYDSAGIAHPQSGRTIFVNDRIACSASLELLQQLADGGGPTACAMLLGYAGWGPGQLEAEMSQGSWIPVDFEHELVFETPVEHRWKAALATLGIDPARVVDTHVANA